MMLRNAERERERESGFRTVDVFIGGGVKPDHFVDVVVCCVFVAPINHPDVRR